METSTESLQKNLTDREYRRKFIMKCFQNPSSYKKGELTNFLHLPWEECDRMVQLAECNGGLQGRTFCVHNIELLEVLRFDAMVPRESITFVSDREDKDAFAGIYGVETISASDWFHSDRKWDYVFCLPPFAMNLYVNYMVKCVEKANILSCTITPSIWLLTKKSTRRNKKWSASLALLENRKSIVELFNGSDITGNRFPMPMMRVTIMADGDPGLNLVNHLSGEEFKYANPEKVDKYGNSETYLRLLKKIDDALLKYRPISSIVNKGRGDHYVNIASIRGHSIKGHSGFYSPDYFTFLPDDAKVEDHPEFQYTSFQTYEQANAFLSYLRSDFARFCLSVVKINTHLNRGELHRVPLPDITFFELSEKDIMEQFSITEKEMNFIKSRNMLYGKTPEGEIILSKRKKKESMDNKNLKTHFYWFSKNPADEMPEGIPVCITSFKRFHPEFPTVLHTNLENIPEIKGLDEVRKEILPACPYPGKNWVNMQHGIDYKRLQDAIEEGGIFLDLDFTFIRRMPDEFIKPVDGKVYAYNIYDGWHPSFCIASFSVADPGNKFLKAWKDWYSKDYNNVDYNWNGNFIGGLAENALPGSTKHLGTGPLYDYVPAGKMDWNFKEYYNRPKKDHVCAIHWGTCYVISVAKDKVNAWTSAKHFVETGKFLEDYGNTGKNISELDFNSPIPQAVALSAISNGSNPGSGYRCHIYVMNDSDMDAEFTKFLEEKKKGGGNVLVHFSDIMLASEVIPGQEISPEMNVKECFTKYGGIHLIYKKKETK